MKIDSNSNFKKLCDINSILSFNYQLPIEFKKLLKRKVVVVDGCFYYDFLAPEGPYSKAFTDRTGNEASYNNILVVDYFEEEIDGSLEVRYGVLYAFALFDRLSKEFNKENFIVIFSNDGEYSSVTFHKVRDKEEYLFGGLDSYQLNSLLVIGK